MIRILEDLQIKNEANDTKIVKVHNNTIRETDKAIGFTIQRNDGVRLPNFEYIPKSCIISTKLIDGARTEFLIKTWILNKKIKPGFSIVQD